MTAYVTGIIDLAKVRKKVYTVYILLHRYLQKKGATGLKKRYTGIALGLGATCTTA